MAISSLASILDSAGIELATHGLTALGARFSADTRTYKILETTVARDLDSLDRLECAWRAMSASGLPTPFHAFDSVRLFAAETLRRGNQLAVLAVGPADAPNLIWPLAVTRRVGLSVAHWLGEPLAQYGDVITGREGMTTSVEAEAWRVLEGLCVDAVILRNVRSTAAVAALLEPRLEPAGEDTAPFVDCDAVRRSGGLEQVLASRMMRRQRGLERKFRALGDITFQVHEGEDARPVAEAALVMKREWLARRGLKGAIVEDANWSRVLVELATRPGGAVSTLKLDGRMAAAEIGFHHNGHYVSYLGAFASDLYTYAPGRIQIRATIDWCIAKGHSSYDLLAPDDAYKYDWSTSAAPVRTYVHAKTLRGRAAVFGVKLKPRVKRVYYSLPPAARRVLGCIVRV